MNIKKELESLAGRCLDREAYLAEVNNLFDYEENRIKGFEEARQYFDSPKTVRSVEVKETEGLVKSVSFLFEDGKYLCVKAVCLGKTASAKDVFLGIGDEL